jgi:hypothetical protein
MADAKISQLPPGAPAQAGDEYVVARSGANFKLTLTDIAASMPPIGVTTPNTGAFTTLSVTGGIGAGAVPTAGTKVFIGGSLQATANEAYGVRNAGTFSSGATTSAVSFDSAPSTEAASYTAGQIIHFGARQGTIGAGSTVSNQYGFAAQSSLTGATNNYGFFGNIPTAANRWNFYAAGTAPNYFEGIVGIGGFINSSKLGVAGTYPTSSAISRAVTADGTVPSGATSEVSGFYSKLNTQAASFTVNGLVHFYADQGTLGAGSAITTQYGFIAAGTLIGATNNYGYYSDIAAGSNRWNFYANGSARNYFEGRTDVKNTRIEATTNWNGVCIDATAVILIEDGATVTISSSICGAVTVHVYDEASGQGGVFFATYNTTVTKIAGDGEATDTGSSFAVYKSASSHTLTLKNRYGGAVRSFRVAVFAAQVA